MKLQVFQPEPGPQHPASAVFIGPEGASFEFGRGFLITRGTPTEADYQSLAAFRRAHPPAPARQPLRQVKVMGVRL